MTTHPDPDLAGAVVVGTDGSPTATGAVRWAAARAARTGCRLVILLTVPDASFPSRGQVWRDLGRGLDPADQLERVREQADRHLSLAREDVTREHPDLAVETVLVSGDGARRLVEASHVADLVVVGARGASAPIRARALGGTADEVVTHAHGPVVVVPESARAEGSSDGRPVVVGVDTSPTSVAALERARDEARATGVGLVVVHAWDVTPWLVDAPVVAPDTEALRRGIEALTEAVVGDLEVSYVIEPDHPAHLLVKESGEAGLVVVGSRGRGGFAGLLLGSVSRAVLREAACPVLVVRPRGAAS